MNLFRAATTGIDPQTGSYLSKKQRVAMFRESIGSNGRDSGADSSSGFIQPQSGIVVKNRMAEVVEKLQVNTFQAIENVDAKVDVNKKDISALVVATQEGADGAPPESETRGNRYAQAQSSLVNTAGVEIIQQLQTNYEQGIEQVIVRVDENAENVNKLSGIYAQDSKDEAKSEKLDTRSLLRDRQRTLRALREKLVEGIGSSLGKIQSGIQNISSKVGNLAKSFLQKLGEFIALFGLAWLVDNYETLSSKFSELFGSFDSLKSGLLAGIGNVKGVWSLIDIVLRKIWKLTSDLVGTLYRVAKWVVTAVANLVKRVFGVLGDGLKRLKEFFNPVAKVAPDAAKVAPDALPAAAKTTKTLKQAIDAVDLGPEGPVKVKPKGLFGRIGEAAGKLNPFKQGDDAAKAAGDGLTKEQEGWLKRLIKPLTEKFPKLPTSGLLGGLKRIPFIGAGIDIAINRGIDGESWMYSIISGIISATAGGGGAVVGMKAGAAAGALAGSVVPVLGTAIGGGIGAAIGGLLGGYLAGTLAENAVDSTAAALGIDKSAKGTSPALAPAEKEPPKLSAPQRSSFSSSLSTPDGMGLPKSETGGNITSMDMGTEVIDARTVEPKEQVAPPEKNYSEVNPVPTIMTSDPETDIYRSLATTVYDLAS